MRSDIIMSLRFCVIAFPNFARNLTFSVVFPDIEDLQKKVKDTHSAFDADEKEYRQQKDLLRRNKQVAMLGVRKDELRRAMEDASRQEM